MGDLHLKYETRSQFVERIIARLSARGMPDRVIARIVNPLLMGYAPADKMKRDALERQVCVDAQDRHAFRLHFSGGD